MRLHSHLDLGLGLGAIEDTRHERAPLGESAFDDAPTTPYARRHAPTVVIIAEEPTCLCGVPMSEHCEALGDVFRRELEYEAGKLHWDDSRDYTHGCGWTVRWPILRDDAFLAVGTGPVPVTGGEP